MWLIGVLMHYLWHQKKWIFNNTVKQRATSHNYYCEYEKCLFKPWSPHLFSCTQSCEIASRTKQGNSGNASTGLCCLSLNYRRFKHLSQVTKVNMFFEPRGNWMNYHFSSFHYPGVLYVKQLCIMKNNAECRFPAPTDLLFLLFPRIPR